MTGMNSNISKLPSFEAFAKGEYRIYTGVNPSPRGQCAISIGALHSLIGWMEFAVNEENVPSIPVDIRTDANTALSYISVHGERVALKYFIYHPTNTWRQYLLNPDGTHILVEEKPADKVDQPEENGDDDNG